MATVSGQLLYDALRTSVSSTGMQGIGNVPIILQDMNTGSLLAVLTNTTGNFSFTNVPNGNYQLVEAYGTPATLIGTGDFSGATIMPFISQGTVPPISYITNPPAGATNLDNTIRNTRLITVNNANLTAQNFLNGPVKYTSITDILDSDVIVSPVNLITDLDLGTFGTFPSGTIANTGANPQPYPNIQTDFTYSLPNSAVVTPADGSYTIQNIMNNSHSNSVGSWWIIADHTNGNETGRMMVVNGFHPGAIILSSTVSILPNKYYLFTTWILNLCKLAGYADPSLGVNILDESGNIIFSEALGIEIPRSPNYPEWKEIGTVFYSENNHTITLQFISLGPAETGNDYVLDDIALHEVIVPLLSPLKTANRSEIQLGETVTYTITLNNLGTNTLTNVKFSDVLPDGLTFNPGSVLVNGQSLTGVDPNIGFEVPDIQENLTIVFSATATSLPVLNPTVNSANFTYDDSPVLGGPPVTMEAISNEVEVKIIAADLIITKTADKVSVYPDDTITYQLSVINNGPDTALNPMVTDNIPAELKEVFYSLDNGITWNSWNGFLNIADLSSSDSFSFLIRGKVNHFAQDMITNVATVKSQTADPDLSNNISTLETIINPSANLSVVKSGSPNPVEIGSILTYTVTATNAGPNSATNVVITDVMPQEILNPVFSTDNGISWNPWEDNLSLTTLLAGETINILIQGTISATISESVTNDITIISDTFDPDLTNNHYVAQTVIDVPELLEADLAINKVSLPANAIFGEEVTYYLTVTNNGPDAADNVILVDTAPSFLLNQLFSIDEGLTWQAWNGRIHLGSLANGAISLILVKGILSSAATATLINTAYIFSSTPDPDQSNNQITIETPTSGSADVIITKTSLINPVEAGEQITYQLTVKNVGPSFAYDVLLSDLLPTEISDISYSNNGGLNWTSWSGDYNLAFLAANGSFTILIRGLVSPSASNTLDNQAIVTSITYDPDLTNNQSQVITLVNEAADLAITKTSETIIKAGDVVIYRLQIDNFGPSNAENVVITDIISRRIFNPEYSLDEGLNWVAWSGSINLGTVDANVTVILLIRGTVDLKAFGQITNLAIVASDVSDPNPANNISSMNIDIIRQEADLSITKSASSLAIRAGDQISYTLNIKNNGPDEALDTIITDQIPLMITDVMYSINGGGILQPWTGSYEAENLAVGETISLLIIGTVSTDFSGKIANISRVSSKTFDPDLSNNSGEINVSVSPQTADLAILKTVLTDDPKPEQPLTYQLNIINNGPNTANNVVVTDSLPQGLDDTKFSTNNGTTWNKWEGSYSFPELLANSSQLILIQGIISNNYIGAINNLAIVNSDTFDPYFLNNISHTTTNIPQSAADLLIKKESNFSKAKLGEQITYTITINNLGPDNARNVILYDSADLNNPEYSLDNGLTWLTWKDNLELGSMTVNNPLTILIRGVVSSTECFLVNTAKIVSETFDPNLLNNSDTVVTAIKKELADISVNLCVCSPCIRNCEIVSFAIIINNAGPSDAINVLLTHKLPRGIINPEYSLDNGKCYSKWWGNLHMAIIKANTVKIIHVRGKVYANPGMVLTSTAYAYADTEDPNLCNNKSTISLIVKQAFKA